MKAIYPPNPEWNSIDFRLQLTLAIPSIEIQSIIKYSNEFDPQYKYHLKLDAFLDATSLSEHALEEIRNRITNNYIF